MMEWENEETEIVHSYMMTNKRYWAKKLQAWLKDVGPVIRKRKGFFTEESAVAHKLEAEMKAKTTAKQPDEPAIQLLSCAFDHVDFRGITRLFINS